MIATTCAKTIGSRMTCLLCIGTQKTLTDTDSPEILIETVLSQDRAEEMYKVFPSDAIAIENTLAIAERCNLDIVTDEFHLPEFPLPVGHDLDSYFIQVVRSGLDERLAELKVSNGAGGLAMSEEFYRARLMSEIEVIQRMGFSGYFLIVWDFIRHARAEGIPVGPRSRIGSRVLGCLCPQNYRH